MCKYEWILCKVCGNKTRVKIGVDTVIENFPLFCPKCKQETIINVKQLNISVIKESDAEPITVSEITVVGSFFMITPQAVLKRLDADLSKGTIL